MKNKILLVFILCLLFSVPCFAEEISSRDVSYNEIISDPLNDSVSGSDVIVYPLLTTINDDTETIDYTEILESISKYFEYTDYDSSEDRYSDIPFYLSDNHLYIHDGSDNNQAPISVLFRLLEFPSFDDISYYENSTYRYFVCKFSNDDSVYSYIYFNSSDNSFFKGTIYYKDYEFLYAPTSRMIIDLEHDLYDVKKSTDMCMYLILFLVLERVLYIAWDMFPRKDK